MKEQISLMPDSFKVTQSVRLREGQARRIGNLAVHAKVSPKLLFDWARCVLAGPVRQEKVSKKAFDRQWQEAR
jgi:hypothetical protein